MMYHNKFVASVKANGKVLRENNGEVAVPFGSEYSILLKNLNSVKAQVRVSIDGEEATSGWLIIQPNGKLDLERWIKNNNLSKGNKFKFIERTSKIENHRGIGAEDGLIRVEYKFEKVYQPTQKVIHEHHYSPWYQPWYQPVVIEKTVWPYDQQITWTNNVQGGLTSYTTTSGNIGESQTGTFGAAQNTSIYNCSIGASDTRSLRAANLSKCAEAPVQQQNMMMAMNAVENKAGITVAGSESNQKFYTVSDFACEASEVIVLKLVGAIGETKVTKPITVDVKPTCTTCGRVNRATSKFCSDCGTSLHII